MSGKETGEHHRLAHKELGEQSEVAPPIAQQKLVMLIKLDLEFLGLVFLGNRIFLVFFLMGSLQDDILTPKDDILLEKEFRVKNYGFLQFFNFSKD